MDLNIFLEFDKKCNLWAVSMMSYKREMINCFKIRISIYSPYLKYVSLCFNFETIQIIVWKSTSLRNVNEIQFEQKSCVLKWCFRRLLLWEYLSIKWIFDILSKKKNKQTILDLILEETVSSIIEHSFGYIFNHNLIIYTRYFY